MNFTIDILKYSFKILKYAFNLLKKDKNEQLRLSFQYFLFLTPEFLLVGDSYTGKSCLNLRFAENLFSENCISTIGVDFKIKAINIDGKMVKLQIWDVAGQGRFNIITSSYYRNCQGFIVVYDITNRQSFDNLPYWMDEIKLKAPPDACRILVGNKADLSDDRKVSFEEGRNLADSFHAQFIEASALSGSNVDAIFYRLASELIKKKEEPEPAEQQGKTNHAAAKSSIKTDSSSIKQPGKSDSALSKSSRKSDSSSAKQQGKTNHAEAKSSIKTDSSSIKQPGKSDSALSKSSRKSDSSSVKQPEKSDFAAAKSSSENPPAMKTKKKFMPTIKKISDESYNKASNLEDPDAPSPDARIAQLEMLLADERKQRSELEKQISLKDEEILHLKSSANISSPKEEKKSRFIEILDSSTISGLEKLEKINSGSSGKVYKVAKKVIYALKVMKNSVTHEEFQNFIKEYELLCILEHPNIVKAFGIFLSDDKHAPSILLEFCPTNIEELIKKGSIAKTDVVFVIFQIVEAMKYVHFRNVIHRDLKPSNILVGDGLVVKKLR